MKPFFVLVLVLVVAVGAVLFFQNVGTEEKQSGTPTVTDDDGQPPRNGNDKKNSATLAGTAPDGPALEPEKAALRTPAAILFIGYNDATWTASLRQAFVAMKDLSYATWFLETVGPDGARAGAGPGPVLKLPALTAQPTVAYLEENDIRALFFDKADPNAFPMAFWETVAQRVKSGRMGLYVRPSAPLGMAAHPALSHPIVKDLLPVAKALPVTGTPPAGMYDLQAQSLTVTSEGLRHPATRVVADVDDSTNIWAATRVGDGAYVTKFVYPVEEAKPGAQVLLELDNGDYPALIVSGGNARVLWLGTTNFGDKAEFVPAKKIFQTTVMTHWILWLVGQADA